MHQRTLILLVLAVVAIGASSACNSRARITRTDGSIERVRIVDGDAEKVTVENVHGMTFGIRRDEIASVTHPGDAGLWAWGVPTWAFATVSAAAGVSAGRGDGFLKIISIEFAILAAISAGPWGWYLYQRQRSTDAYLDMGDDWSLSLAPTLVTDKNRESHPGAGVKLTW